MAHVIQDLRLKRSRSAQPAGCSGRHALSRRLPVQLLRRLRVAAAVHCGQVNASRRGAPAQGAARCLIASPARWGFRWARHPCCTRDCGPGSLIELDCGGGGWHPARPVGRLPEPPNRRVAPHNGHPSARPPGPAPLRLSALLARSVLRRSLPRVKISHCAGTGPSGAYSKPRHTLNHRWRLLLCASDDLSHGTSSPNSTDRPSPALFLHPLTRHTSTTQGSSSSWWPSWPRAARCVTPALGAASAPSQNAQPLPRAGVSALPHSVGPCGVVPQHTVMRVARQTAPARGRVSINITTSNAPLPCTGAHPCG